MVDLEAEIHLIILIAEVIAIIGISLVLVRIFSRWILKIEEKKPRLKRGLFVHIRRFFQLIVYSVAVILVLVTLGIDVTGIIAGLGIGALIIGFALKEIIENWISGLLIISGKTYQIGDVITVGDMTGVVIDISLRTTSLKTYDRNEVIIPNSKLLNDTIINLTSGTKETVSSLVFHIDYVFDFEKAKKAIESVLRGQPNVVVDEKRRREIRFIIRAKEWTTEIETLFWIDEPEKEPFIKSKITELVKRKFEEEGLLPPIPGVIRREFLESKK